MKLTKLIKRANNLFQKTFAKANFSDKKYDSSSPKNSNLHAVNVQNKQVN